MLVELIRLIHILLIVGVFASLFINNCYLKELSLTLLIFLLVQYLLGYEKCGLTQLEYWVMGEKYQEGFIYRLINPIIKVREDYFNKGLVYLHLFLIAVFSYQIYSYKCSFKLLG